MEPDECENNGVNYENGDSRQFHILDEINERSSESGNEYSDDSLSYDSDLPEDEIEAMLEEGLPEEFKNRKKRKRG